MRSLVVEEIGAALRYHDLPGPGVPLVFVHGLGCSSSSDFPMVAADPALADRRRILIDLLGSGFSDRPADFSYTIEASADLVGRLIAAATDGPVDLFGHSMGGTIAIVVADRLGERVRRLVLGEPNLDSGGGSYSRRVAAATEADYVAHGHAALIAASRAEGNPLWAATLAASAPHAVHRAAVSLVAGATPSWRQRLLRRAGSATVIFGEASLPTPDTEALPRAGVAVTVLAGAGHSMAWDAPHGLARAIRDGLAA
jgi:pimeloyl-ACP methyl ester carboxylesterase